MKRTKKCLVTGGAGFIGSHLCEQLVKKGYRVFCLDNLATGSKTNIQGLTAQPNFKFIKGDICNSRFLVSVFQDVKPDYVFHLAALPTVQRSVDLPQTTHRVNVTGTLNLLLAAKDQKIKKFVFSSSCVVYGDDDSLPYSEKYQPHPMSLYGIHKRLGEEYCHLFSKLWHLPTVCLRYFNVYGPRMFGDTRYPNLLPKFMTLISQAKTPTIYGTGRQTREFTHVDDITKAIILAAESPVSDEIFNIGSGQSISVNRLVGLLNKLLGKNVKPIYTPALFEPTDMRSSCTKAGKILGWKPQVKFGEGLAVVAEDMIRTKKNG